MASLTILERIDHLVYVAADLDCGIAEIEALLGVRACAGGRHTAWGTHNALVALGATSYLEIIAPDPNALPFSDERPFGLDVAGPSRLTAWATKGADLEQIRNAAAKCDFELGVIQSGSRQQPDGAMITWRLTEPRTDVACNAVPFIIDWGASTHPAVNASKGAALVDFYVVHPEADRVRQMLRGIAIDMRVVSGRAPALIAKIICPRGDVVLR